MKAISASYLIPVYGEKVAEGRMRGSTSLTSLALPLIRPCRGTFSPFHGEKEKCGSFP
jgi:hypothetical protein